jgi:hypothetical protein
MKPAWLSRCSQGRLKRPTKRAIATIESKVNFRILAMPLRVVKAKITARTSLGNPRGLSTALPRPVVGVDVDAGVAGGGAVIGIVGVGVPGPTVTVGSPGVGVAKTTGDEVAVGSALVGKRLPRKANAASARLISKAKTP